MPRPGQLGTVRGALVSAIVVGPRAQTEPLSALLRVEGWSVRSHVTAEAALGALDERAPELVASDFWLPGMNGLEFLAETRRRRPSTNTVLVSAVAPGFTPAIGRRLGLSGWVWRRAQTPWWQRFAQQAILHRSRLAERGADALTDDLVALARGRRPFEPALFDFASSALPESTSAVCLAQAVLEDQPESLTDAAREAVYRKTLHLVFGLEGTELGLLESVAGRAFVSADLRTRALDRIREAYATEAGVRALVERVIQDNDLRWRYQAAWHLVRLAEEGHAAARHGLTEVVTLERFPRTLRQDATAVLAQMNPPAKSPIFDERSRSLSTERAIIRRAIRWGPTGYEWLATQLPTMRTQASMLEALRALESVGTVEPIHRAVQVLLHHESEVIREEVGAVLGRWAGGALKRILPSLGQGGDLPTQRGVLRGVRALGWMGALPAIHLVESPDWPESVRLEARHHLEQHFLPEDLEGLLPLSRGGERNTHNQEAENRGPVPDPIPELMHEGVTWSEDLRIDALASLLASDGVASTEWVRGLRHLVRAFSRAEVREVLEPILESDAPQDRKRLAVEGLFSSLRGQSDEALERGLINLLEAHESIEEKVSAAKSLAIFGGQDALAVLESMSWIFEDDRVRQATRDAAERVQRRLRGEGP